MKTLILFFLLVLSACGSSSGSSTDSTPAPSGSSGSGGSGSGSGSGAGGGSTVTTTTFGFFNYSGICAAVDAWNPTTEKIVFPQASGGTYDYTFDNGTVYIGPHGAAYSGPVGFGGQTVLIIKGTQCTITVTDGVLIDVN